MGQLGPVAAAALDWMDSYPVVRKWLKSRLRELDLPALLERDGGLTRITNFLPTFVADGCLEILENLSDWNKTEATQVSQGEAPQPPSS